MSDWNYLSYKDSDNYAPTSWRNYMLPWQDKCWLFGVKRPSESMQARCAEWGEMVMVWGKPPYLGRLQRVLTSCHNSL